MLALYAILPLLVAAAVDAAPLTKRYTRAKIVSGRDGKCLSSIARYGSGSAVFSGDCASASTWDINPGSGSVILSGTNLALDAGSNPGNNGALKVWTSYPGLYQQTWYLTGDNRIAITGGNQCLDEGDNGIQTYQCTTGNTNQVFYIQGGDTPPPSSSVQPPPSSSSAQPPPSSSAPPPPTSGRRIHPNGDNNRCLTVQNGYAAVGASVAISSCFDASSPFLGLQSWDVNGNGAIRLSNTNYCLDAGSVPADGTLAKIWTCYDGLSQQTWGTGGGKIRTVNNQCLDVRMESTAGYQKPYPSLKDVQTWTCYDGNTNQQWTY